LLALAALVLLFQATRKELVVWIDGQPLRGSTHARTVGSALRDLGVTAGPHDQVVPSVDERLRGVTQIEVRRAWPVAVDLDGKPTWIETTARTPANLLAERGQRIFPGDQIFVDSQPAVAGSESLHPGARVRFVPAHELTIQDGDQLRSVRSAAPTLGAALEQAGIALFEGDRVTPALVSPLRSGMQVTIRRAGLLSIQVDGQELNLRAGGDSVGQALAGAGIALTGLDYTEPPLEEALPPSGVIRVVRVKEALQVELEPVAFDTVYQPLDTLELDSIQVVDAGTYGVLQNRVRVRYEDGIEVARTVDEARVVVEPEPRVLGYGTKIVVRTLSTPNGTIEYWREIPIYATSYSPCNLGVPYCGERTASGRSVERGVIGVIRSWYNLMRGWPVFVPGYGPGTFEDIGAGIAGRDWIDLGFTDENFEPWHQWTTLYFLTPVPPLDSIPWILP